MTTDVFLDTNILIALLDRTDPVLPFLMDQVKQGGRLCTGSIAWHEFVRGNIASTDVTRVAAVLGDHISSCTREDAELSGVLFNATGRRRSSTSDCLIAATCIRLDAAILTRNQKDFIRFVPYGLRLVEFPA